ncbi:hypothetical protein L596_013129 [Steinernema carpocapsae]|nr:hypothetical protein L596_013129 [Steinernema carpocapsae]
MDYLSKILGLASNVFPPAGYMQTAVDFLLNNVMPQPDTEIDKLKQQITDLSGQMQKGFNNIENMINKMQFEQDVANPTKVMAAALHSYLKAEDNANRKKALFDTCVQVSPCTRLDIFYTNMFRNNPQYVNTFLENTKYGHNEIKEFRSYLVNNTVSLMSSCVFCEQMLEKPTYSVANLNIERAREFANQLTVELSNAYKKQQDEYFPTHLKNYLDPYIKSTVNSIGNHDDAAKKVCDYIKGKYSILTSSEYRSDNFVCISYSNYADVGNVWNYYITKYNNRKAENTLLMMQYGKRAYLIYRPSSTEEEYKKHKANVYKIKNFLDSYTKPIRFSDSWRKDIEKITNDAAASTSFLSSL